MPHDPAKAREQWLRYTYARDTGHLSFVRKSLRCEQFVTGDQWDAADRSALRAARRPALTINKLLITLASVTGEQIETRSEISFRPRSGATSDNAELMTKVFRFISDQNQLNWVRTEVFADGSVSGRGYYDVRLDFKDSAAGEIRISTLNPRNVLPDPDATRYDPEEWNDVIVTSWHTVDDIAILYNKADAEALRSRMDSAWAYGSDSIDMGEDRFGGMPAVQAALSEELKPMMRNVRVIDRQHRVLTMREMLIDARTGLKRPVPGDWTKEMTARFLAENPNVIHVREPAKRIRWTVTADDFVLHDDWSPYEHFTVVPFFPVFRHGRTVGLIESLLDPQELLNKTLSQELHVVNTMANSGWKVRSNALLNMTLDELEEVGAKTGIVLEVNGDPEKDIVKIQPNQIPAGLDRISFKAEGFIKSISGRGDSVMGLDRADVSAKAIGEKKDSADVPLRPALDNLERTDWMLARVMLSMVQSYYTDPRILNITRDELKGEYETVGINMPQPGSGEVANDLSLGSFDIIVTSQAAKRTLEESQFEQGVAMRELGIQIPDRFLIENSNLVKKAEILKAMDEAAQSESAQVAEKAKTLGMQLEVANLKAQASKDEAEALHKRAKAAKEMADLQASAGGVDQELMLEQQRHLMEMQMMREKHQLEMQIKREEAQMKLQLEQMKMREQMKVERAKAVMAQRQATATPSTVDEAAKLAKAGGGPQPGSPGAQQGQQEQRPSA